MTSPRRRRRIALTLAALAFLLASAIVARWLSADGTERAKVERLLEAQARGDVRAMTAELDGCDAACVAGVERLARRMRHPGVVEIVRYDSPTSHALGEESGEIRVVWRAGDMLPTVQCVAVRRTGNALTGPRVTLLRLGAPIGREASC